MDATWLDRRFVATQGLAVEGQRTLAIGSADVRIRLGGKGAETIVFVCDTPIFIEHYARLFELLTPTVQVLCIELPGMGFSVPKGAYRFTREEQAVTVAAVLDALHLSACTLAFTCVGAYLAPLVAASRADLVRRVILIQAPSWQEAQRWARRIDFGGKSLVATPYVGQLLVRAFRKRIASRWFAKALAPGRAQPFVDTAVTAFDAGATWALASLVQSYFGHLQPQLPALHVPTLALWGDADRTHQRTDKRSVLSLAPNAEVMLLASAGHCPELEEPERFCELLQRFLTRFA
jgi:pimeloyl-ACP methyl ester carboxylesterase